MVCIPTCVFSEGIESNTLFTTLSGSQFWKWPKSGDRVEEDGTIKHNSFSALACACGNNVCLGSKGEHFCDASSSTCTPWPLVCQDTSYFKQLAGNESRCDVLNQRCECSKCETGFWGAQCKACPHPFVALVTDMFIMIVGGYFCCAGLYYMLRPKNEKEREAIKAIGKTGSKGSKGGGAAEEMQGAVPKTFNNKRMSGITKVSNLSRFRLSFLGRILINHMQIATLFLSKIQWSKALPSGVVTFLVAIGNLLSINLPGMMSSPDCSFNSDNNWSPIGKWW